MDEEKVPVSHRGTTNIHSGDYDEVPTSHRKGLSVAMAAVFIAGEMAGSGVLALPYAMAGTGWIGIVLMVYFCFSGGYTGAKLGACWTILEERYPEYQKSIRYPYPAIGYVAYGKWGRILVSLSVNVTLFGVGTVFLILTAEMLRELLQYSVPGFTICHWILIVAASLYPIMCLGTPKDFWFVGMGALSSTSIACLLITIQIIISPSDTHEPSTDKYALPGLLRSLTAFGTIVFSFGGASTFPTIQNDMKDKSKFHCSVAISFSILLLLYLPVSISGYFRYGKWVLQDILLSLSPGVLVTITEVFLACHLFFAFVIATNPVSQELEELLHVPREFNWKRCLLRLCLIMSSVFVSESIPSFGQILALVGGSTVTLLAFILPPLFYMKLCNMKSPVWPQKHVGLAERVYLWELVCIGVVGGILSTYSAVQSIITSGLTHPCYTSTV